MDDKEAFEAYYNSWEPGMTRDEMTKNYTKYGQHYDEVLSPSRYKGPESAVNEVVARIPEGRRSSVRIIDVAAGTGRVGTLLKDKGFLNVDALEPSEGMMDVLRKTGAYTKTYLEFLGIGQNSVPEDTYDVLVIVGGFAEAHVPVSGIDDMIRITKPGGLVIIVMRKEFLDTVEEYKDRLVPYMDEMETRKKWTKVHDETIPKYVYDKDGLLLTYKVT